MKIAYDYQIFSFQSYGGISRYYTFLADELVKQEQDIGIFAGIHRNNYLHALPAGVVRGTQLSRYPPKSYRAFQLYNHGVSQLQMQRWKPDIIHETYYSSLPVLNINAVRVTSVYDMIHELYTDQFSSRDKTTDWKKKIFSRVDHIISISESTKQDLVALFGVDESKISVVHLGVDPSLFQREVSSSDASNKPYLLYVGGRDGYKNFGGFIKAVASSSLLMADFDVIAFGGGRFSVVEQNLISSLGFAFDQVRQKDGADSQLAQLYSNASAFIYPSLYEGFGLPPLEAMSAGCPVVSSNISSMPEVVRNAGVYFNPHDIEDMRKAIERVVSSEDLKNQLVTLGYENVKNFSWNKCASETLEIYRKLTGKL